MKISNIQIWNGRSSLGSCDISWKEDTIESIEKSATDNHADLSIIPGFIDTHVHLVRNAGKGRADLMTWPIVTPKVEQVLHGVSYAQRAMKAGVTTVRDMAGDESQIAMRRAFDMGLIDGPRVLVNGIVSMTAGHGDLFTPSVIKDRRPTADGVTECRKLVRHYVRIGVDGIKVPTSGGVMSAGDQNEWRNYTDEELAAIVDEAHALNLPVASHSTSESGIASALRAGVDSLEHASLITESQAEETAKRGITIAPTLLILNRIVSGQVSVPEESLAKAKSLFQKRNDRLRRAREKGVTFVLGTDSSEQTMPIDLAMDELSEMCRVLGISAEEALKSATSLAAKVVRRESTLGTLAKGYSADFLIVRKCPWEDISSLKPENLVTVVSRGKVVSGTVP